MEAKGEKKEHVINYAGNELERAVQLTTFSRPILSQMKYKLLYQNVQKMCVCMFHMNINVNFFSTLRYKSFKISLHESIFL